MIPPALIPIAKEDHFCFGCHHQVPCFNQCCQNLNQALTPYDVLRLKRHLGLTARMFFDGYAVLSIGPASGLPVASLRFAQGGQGSCPFVSQRGCQVYPDRPSSCRIYPLARALHRSRTDGGIQEHYALIQEPHCRGFEQAQTQTVREWIIRQELEAYHLMNDVLLELIALKNQVRPNGLNAQQQQWAKLAFYDIDTLRAKALAGELPHMEHHHLPVLSGNEDDEVWFTWSMVWIGQVLFGKRIELDIASHIKGTETVKWI